MMHPADPIRDTSGRIVAPPQASPAPRPMGPWNHNAALAPDKKTAATTPASVATA